MNVTRFTPGFRTDGGIAAEAAELRAAEATAARDEAVAAQEAAEAAAEDAEAAKEAAEAAKTDAEGAAETAVKAKAGSEAAQAGAITARQKAETLLAACIDIANRIIEGRPIDDYEIPSLEELMEYITQSREATAAANTAAGAASGAAGNATTAAGEASTAAGAANSAASSANAAAAAANQAAGAANSAAGNATTAAGEASTAAGAANSAASSANAAAAAANQAASGANQAFHDVEQAAGEIMHLQAQATTLQAGSPATASYENGILNIGVPEGADATISSQTQTYQVSQSGTVTPDGTWLDQRPATPQGYYLWERTVISWNDGTTTVLYGIYRQPADGTGSANSVDGIFPDSSGDIKLPKDQTPTAGSTKLITSGAVAAALEGKADAEDAEDLYRALAAIGIGVENHVFVIQPVTGE